MDDENELSDEYISILKGLPKPTLVHLNNCFKFAKNYNYHFLKSNLNKKIKKQKQQQRNKKKQRKNKEKQKIINEICNLPNYLRSSLCAALDNPNILIQSDFVQQITVNATKYCTEQSPKKLKIKKLKNSFLISGYYRSMAYKHSVQYMV
eukprot:81632_1